MIKLKKAAVTTNNINELVGFEGLALIGLRTGECSNGETLSDKEAELTIEKPDGNVIFGVRAKKEDIKEFLSQL